MPKKVLKPLQESIMSSTKPFLWNGGASNENCQSKPHSLKNKSPQSEPPSISLLSCTSKAATPPRRALIHQQTTQKPQKRRAQCHHVFSLGFDEHLHGPSPMFGALPPFVLSPHPFVQLFI